MFVQQHTSVSLGVYECLVIVRINTIERNMFAIPEIIFLLWQSQDYWIGIASLSGCPRVQAAYLATLLCMLLLELLDDTCCFVKQFLYFNDIEMNLCVLDSCFYDNTYSWVPKKDLYTQEKNLHAVFKQRLHFQKVLSPQLKALFITMLYISTYEALCPYLLKVNLDYKVKLIINCPLTLQNTPKAPLWWSVFPEARFLFLSSVIFDYFLCRSLYNILCWLSWNWIGGSRKRIL